MAIRKARPTIRMKKGEQKTVRFRIKDADGNVIDCTNADYLFGVKESIDDTSYIIEKDSDNSGDFVTTDEANGIVTIEIDSDDSNRVGRFLGELKVTFSGGEIDKSGTVDVLFEKAVTG
jgi:hypothetical protein